MEDFQLKAIKDICVGLGLFLCLFVWIFIKEKLDQRKELELSYEEDN